MVTGTVAELVAALRAKKVSSVELTRALLARHREARRSRAQRLRHDRRRRRARASAGRRRGALEGRRGAARGRPDRAQGRDHDRGASDDLRLAHARELHGALRRARRHGPAQRRHRPRRQDQHGRVRDGLVERDVVLRTGAQPVEPASTCRAAARAGRRQRSPRASCRPPPAPTPAARSASPRR